MGIASKQHLLEVKINAALLKQTDWARDLLSKAKPNTLCFFNEALCGWETTKNNLHNMVEKKLIPQPHLSLWLRLLISQFMTVCVCVYCHQSVWMCSRVCLSASSQSKGKVVVFRWERSRLTNNIANICESCCGIPPSFSPTAACFYQTSLNSRTE